MPRPLLLFAISLALAACAGGVSERAHLHPAPAATTAGARIVSAGKPLECVAYARKASAVSIRGDAWTWWRSAKGRYRRDNRPAVGSVLVLRRSNRLRLGHLAVVTRVVSKREIIVDHANWLNRGKVHLGTPVRDVSAAGDWSAVRVWYTPGRTLGRRTYPAYGFIHPTPATT
ncbi:MAG: CHAP domain-containing protein [Alphaproteobacteria bacterium]